MTKYIVAFVTCSSKKEAMLIANKLLNKKLAACVNIIEGLSSFFWWKGTVDKAAESLLIIKTVKNNFGKIEKTVKKLHSYDVPEIIALPIVAGSRSYLKWIDDSIKI